MKTPNSAFFQPYLRQARSHNIQLATELLVNRLENTLVRKAEETARKYSPKAVKTTAHALENLVLRHTQPDEWAGYLQHEIERKSGPAQNLLKDVQKWLNNQPDQPVSAALVEAANQMQSDYKDHHAICPLSGQDLDQMKTAIYPAALREFLAHLLGRLTE